MPGAGAHLGMIMSSPIHRPPRGLVVDDDKVIANALKRKLEDAGFSVVICHDGDQAIDSVELYQFAFILLDLGLPGSDGIQILEHLPETTNAETPVFVLTGQPDKCDQASEAGAKHCFLKTRCKLTDVVSGIHKVVTPDP